MKKLSINKKSLELNKQTIAKLNSENLHRIKGGITPLYTIDGPRCEILHTVGGDKCGGGGGGDTCTQKQTDCNCPTHTNMCGNTCCC